jgi:peptidoglycan hydrolase-like protein with peptidoglycan-binding domain
MKLRLNGFGQGQSSLNPLLDASNPDYVAPDGGYGTTRDPNAGSSTIKAGMRGELVRDLQGILLFLGYKPGPVDGIFGVATDAAVRAFQRNSGLRVDGVVGQDTWSALRAAYAAKKASESKPTPTTPPSTSNPPTGTPPLLSRDPVTCAPGDYYCAGVTPPWETPSFQIVPSAPPPDDITLPVSLVGAALGGVLGYAYSGRPLGGAVGVGAGGLAAWALWSFIKAY